MVRATEELPPGAIFILKNLKDSINKENRNRIHPFYMVYVRDNGDIVCDYLNPKDLLDAMRLLARDHAEPFKDLCKAFNKETDNGKKMDSVSELLRDAINSIIDAKEESEIDSLFTPGGTLALLSEIEGLDDFELISFFVVR